MKISDMMSQETWNKINEYAQQYDVAPGLIAAIGWHETQWGRLGAGRESQGSYVLGYGYYPGSELLSQTAGIDNQIRLASQFISNKMQDSGSPSYDNLMAFSCDSWRAGNPPGWANSVWIIYNNLDYDLGASQVNSGGSGGSSNQVIKFVSDEGLVYVLLVGAAALAFLGGMGGKSEKAR